MNPADLQRFEKAVRDSGDVNVALEQLASFPSDPIQTASVEDRIQSAALKALAEEGKKT